ncbi:hypothetical protein [uncultured Salinicola sp.]|uniref:ATP-dependent DNA ligase n=1 Tax=uncultured Salinicola sp. TaxID=1193542 RepID=UPI00260B4D84|nr:hypothetical protein [uncultured Salinicola sp.]|tara:strand:+ start:198 stop:1100 length:903 start_codon:yes stop_codon:yes gene_type:complete
MTLFPQGWALQKPVQTIEPEEFNRMWQRGQLIGTRKRDGNRAHVITAGENTRIYSRNGTLDWTDKLRHVVWAFKSAPQGWMFDVEAHTLEEGTYSFQRALNDDPEEIFVSPFDMLRLDGSDACNPYEDRFQRVKDFMQVYNSMPISTMGVEYDLEHIRDYDGMLAEIERRKMEGLVFWDRTAPHALNLNGNTKRGRAWKVKIRQTEDLIVTGWNPNKGDPSLGAGSLDVKRYDENGKLVKAGRVGSFDKRFDRHAVMTMMDHYVVEVSHYGLDENGNMVFPKVERMRPDLASDFGLPIAA